MDSPPAGPGRARRGEPSPAAAHRRGRGGVCEAAGGRRAPSLLATGRGAPRGPGRSGQCPPTPSPGQCPPAPAGSPTLRAVSPRPRLFPFSGRCQWPKRPSRGRAGGVGRSVGRSQCQEVSGRAHPSPRGDAGVPLPAGAGGRGFRGSGGKDRRGRGADEDWRKSLLQRPTPGKGRAPGKGQSLGGAPACGHLRRVCPRQTDGGEAPGPGGDLEGCQ